MSFIDISNLTRSLCEVWKLDMPKTRKIVREVGSLQLWRIKPRAFRALERFEVKGGNEKTCKSKNSLDKSLLKCVSWSPNTVPPVRGASWGEIMIKYVWEIIQNVAPPWRAPKPTKGTENSCSKALCLMVESPRFPAKFLVMELLE